jgi:hypothetical protein
MCPAAAHAQSPPPQAIEVPRWDAGLIVGTFAGRAVLADRGTYDYYGDNWFHSAQGGVFVGRRWTTHFKTEAAFSAAGEGRHYATRLVTVPGQPYPIPYGVEQYTRVRQVALTAAWQFLDNQWVHPFLEAGVAFDTSRTRGFAPGGSFYSGDARTPIVLPPETLETRTRTVARALIGGGAKLYATPRLFFRTDARGAVGSRLEQIAFRAGIGVDF